MKKDRKQSKIKYTLIFILVLVLWSSCWYLTMRLINDNNSWEHRGQFGDMFGAVNALFSGLAFAGIIITILLQREELRLQRRELKLTRKEFKDQNDTLWLQRFENTFFNLLSLHNSIVEGATHSVRGFVNTPPTITRGRAFYDAINGQLRSALESRDITEEAIQKLNAKYPEAISGYRTAIYLFLESVYRVAKFIHDSDLVYDEEKKFYYSILESSLSDSEKTIIYYHLSFTWVTDTVTKKIIELDRENKFFSSLSFKLFDESHSKLRDLTWK